MPIDLDALTARAGDDVVWRAGAPDAVTEALDDTLRGRACADGPWRWRPDAVRDALPSLSLSSQRRALLWLAPGYRWDPSLAAVLTPVDVDPDGASRHVFDPRGHAGVVALRALGSDGRVHERKVHVRADHLDETSLRRVMLDELAAVHLGSLLAARPSRVGVDASGRGAPDDAERLVVLRWLLADGALARALRAIERRPLTALARARVRVPLRAARSVWPDEVARAGGAHDAVVTELRTVRTDDTPENRTARAVCDEIRDAARALARRLPDVPEARRIADDVDALVAGAAALARVPPLRGPAPMHAAALHHTPGYRELMAIWAMLRDAVPTLRWDAVADDGVRDTPTLYERWCALEVARALGCADEDLRALLAGDAVACALDAHPLTLQHQRRFEGALSYSLAFRPDLTVSSGPRRALLDAKFRVDPARGDLPHDEVVKMHAYRDAIAGVWGAWALYPGDVTLRYDDPSGGGVGALPWVPTTDVARREDQRAHLRSLLRGFVTV